MVTEKPNINPKGLFNVTQTAEVLGVSRRTITRYIENGVLKFSVRKTNLRKVTTGAQILKCWASLI